MPAKKPIPPCTSDTVLPPVAGHAYFEDCANHPFRSQSQKFQLVNAWWLAEASLLAYAEAALARSRFEAAGFTVSGPQPFAGAAPGASTQCYVAHSDQMVIVAFRGTQTLKAVDGKPAFEIIEESVADIYTDMKFRLVHSGQGGFIHKGFGEALQEVWPRLEAYLKGLRAERPQRTFWFTGHSLGGALATLAADRFGQVAGLYTFGSPRVGDTAFHDDFSIPAYRFVNNQDIVPRVPPFGFYDNGITLGEYRHVGQPKFIDADGHIHDSTGRWEREKAAFRGMFGTGFPPRHLRTNWAWGLSPDFFNDHGPLYYALKVWNNYIQDRNG